MGGEDADYGNMLVPLSQYMHGVYDTLINGMSPAPADTQAPSVSFIVAAPGRTTAVVSWTTNEPSNSSVNYGTGISLDMAASDPSLTMSHYISLSGLSETTLYYYAVRSCDASGNCNTSSTRNFTTTSLPDTAPPTVLITSPSDGVNVNGVVVMTATATDNIGVSYLEFYDNGTLLLTDYTSPYSYAWNTVSEPNGQHMLMARAADASNNYAVNTITVNVNNAQGNQPSGPSGSSGSAPPSADKTPPTTPANLVAKPVSPSKINLTWSASTDDVKVIGYKIYRNGVYIATSKTTSYSDTGLSPDAAYTYTILAYDASDNPSSQSPPASARTLASETLPSTAGGETEEGNLQTEEGKNVTAIGLFDTMASMASQYPIQYAAFFVAFAVIMLSIVMLHHRRSKKRNARKEEPEKEKREEEPKKKPRKEESEEEIEKRWKEEVAGGESPAGQPPEQNQEEGSDEQNSEKPEEENQEEPGSGENNDLPRFFCVI